MDDGLPLLHSNSHDPARSLLIELRNALLRLHKTLLDNERYEYEQVHAAKVIHLRSTTGNYALVN